MKEIYEVTVDRPDDVSIREMTGYIREAVGNWSGSYHPSDPLFGLADPTVKRKPPAPKQTGGVPDRRAGRKDTAARKGGTKKGGAQ